MASKAITCAFCGRNDFMSDRGLKQHIFANKQCFARYQKSLGLNGTKIPAADALVWNQAAFPVNKMQNPTINGQIADKRRRILADQEDNAFFYYDDGDEYEEEEDEMQANMPLNDNNEGVNNNNDDTDIHLKMRDNFQNYLQKAATFAHFDGSFATAIRLLHTLRKQKCSLDTYDAVCKWHFIANNEIRPHEKVKQAPSFWSRDTIYAKLRQRYNRCHGYGNIAEIVLPSNCTKARIVWNDAQMVIQSLLTDPRITANDYLFFNEDPFAPPPDDLNYIADINTGKCYRDTYNELITDPQKQILVPIILYVDGTVTGQFVDLPITAVQIALGIHTRAARDKAYCWGTLGYIPDPSKVKSHGKRQLIDSGHVEGTNDYHELLENEGQIADNNVHSSQDLHTMLEKILESYKKIQEKGLIWDFVYNGKVYRDTELVFFIAFIKCDTDEADKLCGSYTSRGRNVSQLCRFCECPTAESGNPLVRYPLKTKEKIDRLVKRRDIEALKGLSQQCMENAFYPLRFGSHSPQHIHGATPLEMLHALLLGLFMNVRDTFFKQVGDKSEISEQLNTLACEYGVLLSRQSDRELPTTRFYGGIRKGH